MKAIVAHGARDLRIEDRAVPEPGPGQVLIRLQAGGICGSDLTYIKMGGFCVTGGKMPLGHEISGTVDWVGSEEGEGAVMYVRSGARVEVPQDEQRPSIAHPVEGAGDGFGAVQMADVEQALALMDDGQVGPADHHPRSGRGHRHLVEATTLEARAAREGGRRGYDRGRGDDKDRQREREEREFADQAVAVELLVPGFGDQEDALSQLPLQGFGAQAELLTCETDVDTRFVLQHKVIVDVFDVQPGCAHHVLE